MGQHKVLQGYYEWGADVHKGKVPLRIEKEKGRAKEERN